MLPIAIDPVQFAIFVAALRVYCISIELLFLAFPDTSPITIAPPVIESPHPESVSLDPAVGVVVQIAILPSLP